MGMDEIKSYIDGEYGPGDPGPLPEEVIVAHNSLVTPEDRALLLSLTREEAVGLLFWLYGYDPQLVRHAIDWLGYLAARGL